MDEFSTTSFTLDQTDEDILTPTVSDEALEAAADIERVEVPNTNPFFTLVGPCCYGG
jgi:hypothetical protein